MRDHSDSPFFEDRDELIEKGFGSFAEAGGSLLRTGKGLLNRVIGGGGKHAAGLTNPFKATGGAHRAEVVAGKHAGGGSMVNPFRSAGGSHKAVVATPGAHRATPLVGGSHKAMPGATGADKGLGQISAYKGGVPKKPSTGALGGRLAQAKNPLDAYRGAVVRPGADPALGNRLRGNRARG